MNTKSYDLEYMGWILDTDCQYDEKVRLNSNTLHTALEQIRQTSVEYGGN